MRQSSLQQVRICAYREESRACCLIELRVVLDVLLLRLKCGLARLHRCGWLDAQLSSRPSYPSSSDDSAGRAVSRTRCFYRGLETQPTRIRAFTVYSMLVYERGRHREDEDDLQPLPEKYSERLWYGRGGGQGLSCGSRGLDAVETQAASGRTSRQFLET